MTVGLDDAAVENVLRSRAVAVPGDRLRGAVGAVGLGPRARWSVAPVGCGRGGAVPRVPANAGAVTGECAAAPGGRGDGDRGGVAGQGRRGAGTGGSPCWSGVPASTVRGWLRRITAVADRVLAVLAASAAELGVEFLPPAPTAGPVGAVVELVGALARGGDAAAGWFVGAVAVGRGAHRRPVAVPRVVRNWLRGR